MGCSLSIHVPLSAMDIAQDYSDGRVVRGVRKSQVAPAAGPTSRIPGTTGVSAHQAYEATDVNQEYIEMLQTSIEQLKRDIDSGNAQGFPPRVETLKGLESVLPGQVLNVVKRLLWTCAEKPEAHKGPLVNDPP
jgi:hypothetical protein